MSFTEKLKMPKVLAFSNIKSAVGLGAWFAACAMSYTVLMGLFEAVRNKIMMARRQREFDALMAKMACATEMPEAEVVELNAEAKPAKKKSTKKAAKK